jgi:hypothetical protein
MGLKFRIRSGLRNLMNKSRAEAELDDELRAYVEMVTDEKVALGVSPEEARRSTLAEFGGVEQVKEAVREERAGAGLELLGQDFRYGLRQLRKSRAFSLAAVLTLALGIGTTAAMFSVVDAVVLRPLPYNNVDRIVDVKTHSASTFWQVCSWPGYLEMRRENATFQDLAGYAPYWGMTLRVGDQAQYVRVTQGTDNFFHVFGVNPMLGRTFLPGEDIPGTNNILVLSYEIWRRAFNGNRNVVAQQSIWMGNRISDRRDAGWISFSFGPAKCCLYPHARAPQLGGRVERSLAPHYRTREAGSEPADGRGGYVSGDGEYWKSEAGFGQGQDSAIDAHHRGAARRE